MHTTQIEYNNHFVNRDPLLTDLKRIKKIAYLENDKAHGAYLTNWLQCRDIKCEVFGTTQEFEQALCSKKYDYVLLDREIGEGTAGQEMLNLINGYLGCSTSVIFVSSRNSREAIFRAINNSATRHLSKSAQQTGISNRVGGCTGKHKSRNTTHRYNSYLIDQKLCHIYFRGKAVSLTPREYKLAITLFENPLKILSHEYLLNAVGGEITNKPYLEIEHLVNRVKRKLKFNECAQWHVNRVGDMGFSLLPV